MDVDRDPEQTETRAIHELIDFADRDVLEIGCGDGRLTWRYADQVRSVLGLDPDATAIEKAHADTPDGLRARVTFQVGDITTLELPTAAFDLAVLSWALC